MDDSALEASGYEPMTALIASEEGLQDLKQIILDARRYLKPGGYLFLEHGYQQAEAVASIFLAAGYRDIHLYQDSAGHDRVSMGMYPD
jgi:release factor glutamine methyltransferase